MTLPAPEAGPGGDLRWVAATLPLAPLALLAYSAFEWLFFATKPSFVSILPFVEQLAVLLAAPLPLIGPVLAAQMAATGVSLLFPPRLRVVAIIPAATILSALVLILADNFLYAVVQMSLIRSDVVGRITYALVLGVACVVWIRKLHAELPALARSGRRIIILWSVTGPLLVAAVIQWAQVARSPVEPGHLRSGRAPNVLILSIDGVDADRLSAYGYPQPTSPFLQSLAGETLFCENAFSNAIETFTSQTSFLTGKSPFTTGTVVPPAILRGDDATEHLPALLRSAGYRSMQLSLRHVADAEDVNMQHGFDLTNYRWENSLSTSFVERVYDVARPFRLAALDRLHARLAALAGAELRSDQFAHVTGDEVNPYWSDDRRVRTLAWFIALNDRPWFAQVHLLDTHVGHHERRVDTAGPRDHYDGLLRRADDHVRQIFQTLRASGELDRTVVVITTDHGSSERGWRVPRIPLMIRFPGGAHARREHRNVQLLDIAPTVLEGIGQNVPPWMAGTSLIDAGALPPERPILASGDVGTPSPRGLLRLPLPAPPLHGAVSVHAVIGSWWYSLDLRSGKLVTDAIRGHTRPSPAKAPAEVRLIIDRLLDAAGVTAPLPRPSQPLSFP